MSIIIIYGAHGTGKSRHGEALCRILKQARLIDGWDGTTPLQDGDLALTNLMSSQLARLKMPDGSLLIGHATVMHVDRAKGLL